MPLQVLTRFSCNRCAVEIGMVVTLDVQSPFPINVQLGIPKAPPGWTVRGTETLCREHAAIVQPVLGMPRELGA
jgi:hypothetical protein